jgi:hypothetical protein
MKKSLNWTATDGEKSLNWTAVDGGEYAIFAVADLVKGWNT